MQPIAVSNREQSTGAYRSRALKSLTPSSWTAENLPCGAVLMHPPPMCRTVKLRKVLRPRRQGRDSRAGAQVSLGIMLAPVTYLTHCTSAVVLLARLRFDTVGHVAAPCSAQRPPRPSEDTERLPRSDDHTAFLTTNPCALSRYITSVLLTPYEDASLYQILAWTPV